METSEQMRHISTSDLAMLGLQHVAFVKPVMVDGTAGFAVCAADGTQMALLPNRDIAFAVVRQNDMEPVSVH